jgi:hypothetical protein
MPDIVGTGGQHEALELNRAGFIKQAQCQSLRMG